MEEPELEKPKAVKDTVGSSGVIGGGEGIDAHTVSSTKAITYR